MLSSTFNSLYSLLSGMFGYVDMQAPELLDSWLVGISLVATIAVFLLPFYIVYKIVRWLV